MAPPPLRLYCYTVYSAVLSINRCRIAATCSRVMASSGLNLPPKPVTILFAEAHVTIGRDYLQVEYYTDGYFPDRNIRFVAVDDCVDSDDGENELAPFRNVMNEMYARDISRKVRSSHRLRGNAGEPLPQPPYGYLKNPENHL